MRATMYTENWDSPKETVRRNNAGEQMSEGGIVLDSL